MKLERPKWPENKKCSAMITINLNAELFWLQLDPTCKDMPKTLSLGQYGMTRGVDRILEVLEERGIRATFFTPGWVAEQYPDKLKAIVEKGHEIAALGYHHEHMALLSEEEQESAIKNGYRQDCPKKAISAGQNRNLFVFAANLRFLRLLEN